MIHPGAFRLRWIVLATVACAGAVVLAPTPPAVGRPTWNEPAPELSVRTLDGTRIEDDDLRGRIVLVNFWATWCPPCRGEMRGFDSVLQEYGDRGFTVVALSTDAGGEAPVRAFVEDQGLGFPVAMAHERVRLAWGGVSMLPQSFLVDREGRVRKIVRGPFEEEELRRAVEWLLEEDR